MKKNEYVVPEMEKVEIRVNQPLLVGSGEDLNGENRDGYPGQH